MQNRSREIGIVLMLFATQLSAQNHFGTITKVPKKVNILSQSTIQGKDIMLVPKKINLLKPQPIKRIVFGKVEVKKDVLAPFQLPTVAEINLIKIPKLNQTATFCGIVVPTQIQAVTNRLHQEFARYIGSKHSVIYYLKRSQRYKAEIEQTLQKHNLPKELFYLAVAESGLANLTSPKGAKGFWQFMPETARIYNLEVSETVDERLHPQKSAEAACQYLKMLHNRFHDWTLAAAAYNMGEGGVENACQSQNTRNYFNLNLNPETAQYIYRIVALKYVLENPKLFGIKDLPTEKYIPIPYETQPITENIDDLETFAKDCDTDLETLKAMNPWLISNKLIAVPGKTYQIHLPTQGSISAEELIERN